MVLPAPGEVPLPVPPAVAAARGHPIYQNIRLCQYVGFAALGPARRGRGFPAACRASKVQTWPMIVSGRTRSPQSGCLTAACMCPSRPART